MIRVTGTDQQDRAVVFVFGEPIPVVYRDAWDRAIAEKRSVGLPWWLHVPSFTEPAGFVAAAIASLYEVTGVEGFPVPPRPADHLPL